MILLKGELIMFEEDMPEEQFKNILRNEFFTYKGKNSDKVFEELYHVAFERGHAYGYYEVKIEFENLNKFLSYILDLTK